MLTDALKVMVNNPFKESFYEEKKSFDNFFFIFHKSGVKTCLKWGTC